MGNKNLKQKHITYVDTRSNPRLNKGRNQIARDILANNVEGNPSDEQITGALAIQQAHITGPLKKTDLITILIRLNPSKNNALISQYKVEDLTAAIRHELYVQPFMEDVKRSPPQATNGVSNAHIEEVLEQKSIGPRHVRKNTLYAQPFQPGVKPQLVTYTTEPQFKQVGFPIGPTAQKAKYYPEKGKLIKRSHMQSPLEGNLVPYSGT